MAQDKLATAAQYIFYSPPKKNYLVASFLRKNLAWLLIFNWYKIKMQSLFLFSYINDMKQFVAIFSIAFTIACNNDKPTTPPEETVPQIPSINYSIVKTYPHDITSFTEGLIWQNGFLYESTGNRGKSKLLKNDMATGKPVQELKLEDQYFGEGIAILNNKIYQLTYEEQKVFVYDLVTFKKIKEFAWTTGEGWGMTTDGKQLILNNGGSNLYFVNPETFAIEKTVPVTDNYGPVGAINEMEYVDGVIYSNIWMTDNIIKINPSSGKVEARIDLKGLLEKNGMTADTEKGGFLNGIAYNPNTKTFYITGKLWPAIFEMKFF